MHDRASIISKLPRSKYDLIIIGGGITGAGVFLDAQSRGLKTLLLEKDDFASGTSSKSTKLIHGGLRYLKQLNVSLVKKTAQERAIINYIAPHLVHPLKVRLPITEHGSLNRITTKFALSMYDYLGDTPRKYRHHYLSKDEILQEDDFINEKELIAGYDYYEYQANDARLVIELIKKGIDLGGTAINYCEVSGFINEQNNIVGIECSDLTTQEKHQAKAKYFINAAGPWVDGVRKIDQENVDSKMILSKGVHLVFRYSDFPISTAYYFDTDDRRMVFAIPVGDCTYFGTTDTFYKTEPIDPGVTQDDVDYLLRNANLFFDDLHLTSNDIISSWSGVRPLINEPGKSPSEISRKDELFISESGLLTIAGGKLTGYRVMAEKALDQLIATNSINGLKNCATEQIIASGGYSLAGEEEIRKDLQSQAIDLKLSVETFNFIFDHYGSNTSEVLDIHRSYGHTHFLISCLQYSLDREMVESLVDFVERRTTLLYYHPQLLLDIKEDLLRFISNYKNWTPYKIKTEQEKLDLVLDRFTKFGYSS